MDNLYSYFFYKYATMYKISPMLLTALCSVETNNMNVINHNDNGSPSFGICQIKSSTADQMGFKRANLMNPALNIQIAAKYLRYQLDRYNHVKHAIAAYNSGSVIYNRGKLCNQDYVNKVFKRRREYFINEEK